MRLRHVAPSGWRRSPSGPGIGAVAQRSVYAIGRLYRSKLARVSFHKSQERRATLHEVARHIGGLAIPNRSRPGVGVKVGVSVVVCAHNSGERIRPVVRGLSAQRIPEGFPWEVVLVDNASADATADVARATWGEESPTELRVVSEPRLGLTYARERGLRTARYPVVSFVDDDNLVDPDWVTKVSEVMSRDPGIGVCGGYIRAHILGPEPSWFGAFAHDFAVGSQGPPGDITWSRGYVWGAGLSIRREAWRDLVESGWTPVNIDRRGETLSSGGDSELCFAVRQAGWRIHYDPSLRMTHELPPQRLEWQYLLRLNRGFGVSSVAHDAYVSDRGKRSILLEVGRRTRLLWVLRISRSLLSLLRYARWLMPRTRRIRVGNKKAVDVEWLLGRIHELARRRFEYDAAIRAIRAAPWNRDEL
jgi:glycosyltransferase involved in cell wall biosynthesis